MQALKLFSQDEKDKEKLKERGVILKNRAACYLKLVSTGNMFCPQTRKHYLESKHYLG